MQMSMKSNKYIFPKMILDRRQTILLIEHLSLLPAGGPEAKATCLVARLWTSDFSLFSVVLATSSTDE